MDFVDATILRLADEALRSAIFDSEALAQVLSASHDVAGTGVEAPFAVSFDELCFVYDDEPKVEVTGSWMTLGQTERTELAIQAAGLGAAIPRADLLMAGAITATARGGDAKLVDVEVTSQPGVAAGAALKVRFGDTDDQAARVRRFPVAAALLVRNMPIQLAGLLDESRRLRPHLYRLGFGSSAPGPRARRAPIVAWVLPAVLFDDEAWPGATPNSSTAEKRAQRRRWAGAWLARERIGLVVPPT